MNQTIPLAPCPFCGGPAILKTDPVREDGQAWSYASCGAKCGAEPLIYGVAVSFGRDASGLGVTYLTSEEAQYQSAVNAATRWNTRLGELCGAQPVAWRWRTVGLDSCSGWTVTADTAYVEYLQSIVESSVRYEVQPLIVDSRGPAVPVVDPVEDDDDTGVTEVLSIIQGAKDALTGDAESSVQISDGSAKDPWLEAAQAGFIGDQDGAKAKSSAKADGPGPAEPADTGAWAQDDSGEGDAAWKP